jgi:cytosine/adenosine deaminase-related metal-dependent hydrolase
LRQECLALLTSSSPYKSLLDIFTNATAAPCQMLGLENVARLANGYKADFILVKRDRFDTTSTGTLLQT